MALPLPAPPGPGGDFLQALNANRMAEQQQLQNQLLRMQNQYAPLTIPAEAASKLAYANLMGPQFLAKLLGNQNVFANMNDVQGVINSVQNAGMGQISPNAFLNMPMSRSQSPIGQLIDNVRNAFNFGGQRQNQNPLVNIPQSISPQGQTFQEASYERPQTPREQRLQEYKALGDVNGISAGTGGNPSNPYPNAVVPAYTGNLPPQTLSAAEKSGQFAGTKKELEKLGEHRADAVKNLNEEYKINLQIGDQINGFADILSNPLMENIRQSPVGGHLEIGYYRRAGTPAERNLLGRLDADYTTFITTFSQKFKGQFRRGEQAILQAGKPNDNDTVESARGKIQAIGEYNEKDKQRNRRASQLIRENHMDEADALTQADKEVDFPRIRRELEDQLHPTIELYNTETKKRETVTLSEARKRGAIK